MFKRFWDEHFLLERKKRKKEEKEVITLFLCPIFTNKVSYLSRRMDAKIDDCNFIVSN